MKGKSKVSILLPVFNGERYLSKAIESVLAQTHENLELLISDNCSTDSTFEIASNYARQDTRIKLSRNSENIGLYANYNKVIAESTGDYIELFSHDDYFEPVGIERLASVLDEQPNVVLVTSNRICLDGEDNRLPLWRPTGSMLMSLDEVLRSNMEYLQNWISSPVMYRSKCKGKGLNERMSLYSDVYYWFQVLEHGDLFYLDEMLFTYRYHLSSGTSGIRRELSFATALVRLADKYSQYMSPSTLSAWDIRKRLAYRMIQYVDQVIDTGGSFDELLSPPDIDFNNENLTELEVSKLDTHDFRRAACIGFNYAHYLYNEYEAAKRNWGAERASLISQLGAACETAKLRADG